MNTPGKLAKIDIVDRLRVALECRVSQGLSFDLFTDAIDEIVRLRTVSTSMPVMPAEVLVDVEQVAAMLDIGSTQVYLHTARDLGFPRPVQITGRGPQWRRGDIEAWSTASQETRPRAA